MFSISNEIFVYVVTIILVVIVCAFIFIRDEKSYTK